MRSKKNQMPEKLTNQPHTASWYAATTNDQTHHPRLDENLTVDVCIIGAGLTGISTALNLAERGHNVAVLEASKVGWAASGRNGGQLIGGFACDIDTFAKYMPDADETFFSSSDILLQHFYANALAFAFCHFLLTM